MAARGPAPIPAPQLPGRLGDADRPPVVVLAGADRWLRATCRDLLVAAALPEGDPGGALVRLDARAPEDRERVGAALDELRTPSLFGGGKVVVLESAEAAGGPKDRSQAAALTRLAREGMEIDGAGTFLVLTTPMGVKGKGSVQTKPLLATGAWLVDCRLLYDAPAPWERAVAPYDHELARFVVTRMHRGYRKRIALEDAHALCARVGNDLGALDDALRSLALYAGAGAAVGAADIEAVIGATREDPVWRLADAVMDGDVEAALALAAQAFERGLPDGRGGATVRPEAIAAVTGASLHTTYRRVLAGAEALARGEPAESVARTAGVPPFLAGPFVQRCRRDPGALLALNRAFLEAEAGTKGGGVPPRLATERLVGTLARGVAAAE
jgi:DNA polymerase III delta subunit